MTTPVTVSGLEQAKLVTLTGLPASTSLADLRRAYYPPLSGLTPAAQYSIRDHMKAYYAAQGIALGSFTDMEIAFMRSRGATGTTYGDLAYSYWTTYGPAGAPGGVSSGLAGWWKADSLSTTPVDTWSDSSGNSRNVASTGGTRPAYSSSIAAANNKPGVVFDGVDDFLAYSGGSVPFATAFMVMATTDTDIVNGFVTNTLDQAANGDFGWIGNNSSAGNFGTSNGNGEGVATSSRYFRDGIATFAFNTDNTFHVYSQDATGSIVTIARLDNGIKFGQDRNIGGRFTACTLVEVICYDRILSAAERQAVEFYLATKYATPVDTFTRANNASSLGTTEVGNKTWQTGGLNVPGVNTNTAYFAGTGSGNTFIDSGMSNGGVSIKVSTLDGGNVGGRVVGRYVDENNFWTISPNIGAGAYSLLKYVSGSPTQVDAFFMTIAAGDVLDLRYNNNTITGFINGVQRLSATDSFLSTATKVGFGLTGTSANLRFDDFKVFTT
jgi:hypothetical protein